VADAEKGEKQPVEEPGSSRASRRVKRARSGGTAAKVKAGTDAVRNRVASVVWLVAVVCALFLAVGALLIALKANEENAVVDFALAGAEVFDLGIFSLEGGVFTFAGDEDGRVKSALVNWGIAAVAYLVVGKILDRVIRP
jgi:hypothetical protein